MLSLACETFRYLLFPFYWHFVFIPVLPEKLLTCLQVIYGTISPQHTNGFTDVYGKAPVPYIVGFQGTMEEVESYVSEEVE